MNAQQPVAVRAGRADRARGDPELPGYLRGAAPGGNERKDGCLRLAEPAGTKRLSPHGADRGGGRGGSVLLDELGGAGEAQLAIGVLAQAPHGRGTDAHERRRRLRGHAGQDGSSGKTLALGKAALGKEPLCLG